MLSKRYRLPLQRVARGGAQLRSPVASVRVLPSGHPYSRFGVVVSTSVDKRATVRNRLRRLAFEVCATLQGARPSDIVIIIQKPAAALPNDRFRQMLQRALTSVLEIRY